MLQIQHFAIDSLQPNPHNTHTHPKKQIDELAESLRRFGFVAPIVTDENLEIVAGHARWQAAKVCGMTVVPVIKIEELSAAKKRALMLADNKIAERSSWDRDLLAVELSEVSELLVAEGLDISITGFAMPEVVRITSVSEQDSSDAVDAIDRRWLSERPVSQRDDRWILGDHCILCGDAHDRATIARLMQGNRAAMAFLDPSGVMAASNSENGLVRYLVSALAAAASVSHDGAVHFVCAASRHVCHVVEAGQQVYGAPLNLAVWIKSADVVEGAFYRSHYELIAVFRVGQRQPNRVRLRPRSDVWRHTTANPPETKGPENHVSSKPVALVADAMKDVTRKGDVVIDTFAGMGTTIIAAEQVGRHARAIEFEPRLTDIAVRRWQAITRREARHAELGLSFNQLADSRQAAPSRVC